MQPPSLAGNPAKRRPTHQTRPTPSASPPSGPAAFGAATAAPSTPTAKENAPPETAAAPSSATGSAELPRRPLAEITLGHDQDFYDVSLVDGYNLAISITPVKGTGKCSYAGCVSDLNMMCPVGLQVRSHDDDKVAACKSACFAFNSPRYCCTGRFGSPQSCRPTGYSRIFKAACPKAYSYAYDDPTSIETCTGGSYAITFCPRRHQLSPGFCS